MSNVSHNPETLYAQAREHFQASEYPNCIRCLSRLISDKDYTLRAWTNIGASLYQMRNFRAARKFLNRGITLEADDFFCQLNLAKTLLALKDFNGASHYFRRVLTSKPGEASAWRGLLESSASLLEEDACLSIAEDWSLAVPDDEESYFTRVNILQRLNRSSDAVRLLRCCKDHISDRKRYNHLLFDLLLALDKLEEALYFCNLAIASEPLEMSYHAHKGDIELGLCRTEDSCDSFQKAYLLSSNSAIYFLNRYFLFPRIPSSADEIKQCRSRCMEGLFLAEKNHDLTMRPEHLSLAHTYYLAYHNQDDKLLLERYHRLLRKLAMPLVDHITCAHRTKDLNLSDNKKINIGFISKYFSNHSNLLAFEGIIRHLDRDKFKVFLINLDGVVKDKVHQGICSYCDEIVYLTDDLNHSFNHLHSLGLDIIYFTDLGMTPYDYFYPMFRSAPIQVTGWGIPHTSGMNDIDYYISAEDIEPDDSESLYTEELVKLPGGLPCCFLADINQAPAISREYFFLPVHSQLVGCLQALHKLHPDFDFLMEEIANQNPDAIFVFVEDKYPECTRRFLDRLERNAPSTRERSVFLKFMSRAEYQGLCSCMDVLLDPIYYGSGITFFEASLVGTIIVTLEGKYLRSRAVASGYREMELKNPPIATTHFEYAEIVTRLLNDPDKRKEMQAEILGKRDRIFNRMDYVRNFEDFCIKAFNNKYKNQKFRESNL